MRETKAPEKPLPNDLTQMTYAVSQAIRNEILQCQGTSLQLLCVDDLNLSISKALLPKSLFWLLRWMITGEESKDERHVLSENADSCPNETDDRRVVVTCQSPKGLYKFVPAGTWNK